MQYELIDPKKICPSCFVDGKIININELDNPSRTWDYSSNMELFPQQELACLYAGTKNIQEAAPNDVKEQYESLTKKMRAYVKSFKIGRAHV